MKKRLVALMILILPIIQVFCVNAEEINSNTYKQEIGQSTVYMHDLANLLTEQEERALIDDVSKYCKKIDYNILFLTTNNTNHKTTMRYSDDYMDALFPKGVENNIAFVIDMDNRKIYINTMGNAINRLSDKMIESGLDKGYAKIKKQDYDGTLKAMAKYCLPKLKIDNFFVKFLKEIPRHIISAGIITAVIIFFLIKRHEKANKKQPATTYVSNQDYKLNDKKENYVRQYQTVQRGYYSSSSGSSSHHSSGGSSHRSSSGRSHGGGGRSF